MFNGTGYCNDWHPWSRLILNRETVPGNPWLPEFWIDYISFICIGLLFAFISVVLVFYTRTSRIEDERDRPDNENVYRYHSAGSGILKFKKRDSRTQDYSERICYPWIPRYPNAVGKDDWTGTMQLIVRPFQWRQDCL